MNGTVLLDDEIPGQWEPLSEDLAGDPGDDLVILGSEPGESESSAGEAEFLLGGLGLAALGGNYLSKLYRGRQQRTPLKGTYTGGQGIGSARLVTPRGSATLRLPTQVPSLTQFKKIEGAVNRNAARLNSTQKDIGNLRARVATVVADVSRDIAKIRKEQKSQATTNLMLSLLSQQRLQQDLESHHHTPTGVVPEGSDADPANIGGGGNMALMMMPLLLGGGVDDSMTMMLMMTMMMNNRD